MDRRVLAFIRVSSGEQSRDPSLDEQKAAIEDNHSRSADRVVHWFIEVESATDPRRKREEFHELLEAARRGDGDVISCWRFDRLVRGWKDAAALKEVLDETGIALEGTNHHIDKNWLAIYLFMAEQDTAARVSRSILGKDGKAKRGKFPVGIAPYGFRKVPDPDKPDDWKLEREAAEAATMYEAYAAVDGGCSTRKYCWQLNSEGKLTRHGKMWTPQFLVRKLRDPLYKGIWRYGKTRQRNYRPVQGGPPIDVNVPPIVDADLWQRVQKRIDQNRINAPRNLQRWHPLRGILRCAVCGKKFGFWYQRNRGYEYAYCECFGQRDYGFNCRHPARLNEMKLYQRIAAEVLPLLEEPGFLEDAIDRWQLEAVAKRSELELEQCRLKRKLKAIGYERQPILTQLRKANIKEADADLQLRAINEEEERYTEELRLIEERLRVPEELEQRTLAVQALRKRVRARLHTMSEIEEAQLLGLVVRQAWLDGRNNLAIELGVPLRILQDAKPIPLSPSYLHRGG